MLYLMKKSYICEYQSNENRGFRFYGTRGIREQFEQNNTTNITNTITIPNINLYFSPFGFIKMLSTSELRK